ncbi:MAG TPA: TonB-dependent receptor [Labilithrix sp.]
MTRREWRRHLWAIVFALLVSVLAMPARADDVADEADHLFSLGAEKYQSADYKQALEYFLASNRLVRNRNVMFNIARTYEHLKNFPDAYRYYQRAGDGETDQAAKGRIKEALGRLAPNVALLRVETDPPGALVYLNRKDLGDRGAAPQTLALNPGTYVVIAELPGYDDATSPRIDAQLGAEKAVSLKLTRVVGIVRVIGVKGAQVRVDADDAPVLCTSPCDAPVPPGQHTLVLARPGFRTARQTVQVKANTIVELKPELEAETGSLVVNADEHEATIEIDGRTAGFTPAVLNVPVGAHDVRVALRGFRAVSQHVEVKAGEQSQIDVSLLTEGSVEAASRVAENIEDAPASVSVVPSPELRAMHYPTVAEAVRGVRGVYVSDDRGYKSVGFRGFGRPGDYGNRVLVLLDGQPTNDNWIWSSYVGYDLRTDIEDVDRIEIVRGPGSLLYGTGAFSGVINVVTNARDLPEGREIGVSVADEGVARGRARITYRFDRDSGITTSVGVARSSGRDFFFPEYVQDGPPSAAGNARGLDSFRAGTVTWRYWYKAFTVQWYANTHDKQLPTGEFDTTFGDARTHQSDTRMFVEAKLEPKITDQIESLTRAHWNYYAYRGKFAQNPQNAGLEQDNYDGSWAGLEQRFAYTPVKQLRLTAGGEGQYHYLAHQKTDNEQGTILDDSHPFTLFAAYLLADVFPTKALKIEGGARLDSYSTFGSSVNPRAAVIVKPYDGGNVKIIAGKAFRAPSIYELFYVAGGGQKASNGLQPEEIYSAEIEYSHKFTQNVTGLVSVYANYIDRLIALRDLPDATTAVPSYAYQNTDKPVGTLGGEVELRREWKEGWMLGASYSFQKSRYLASRSITELAAFSQASDLREVPNSPNHLGSIRGGVPIIQRALVLMSRITLEGPRYDRNDSNAPGTPPQGTTPPVFLWDFVFSGQEPRWGLTYAFGVYNAFDTRWTVPVSAEFRQTQIPQNGRTLMALAAISF